MLHLTVKRINKVEKGDEAKKKTFKMNLTLTGVIRMALLLSHSLIFRRLLEKLSLVLIYC